MTDSMLAAERRRLRSAEWRTCVALLVIGFTLCFGAIKYYRSVGVQPAFYQQNFGPAVMMACGYGFTAPAFQESPASLADFLNAAHPDFPMRGLLQDPGARTGDLERHLVLPVRNRRVDLEGHGPVVARARRAGRGARLLRTPRAVRIVSTDCTTLAVDRKRADRDARAVQPWAADDASRFFEGAIRARVDFHPGIPDSPAAQQSGDGRSRRRVRRAGRHSATVSAPICW